MTKILQCQYDVRKTKKKEQKILYFIRSRSLNPLGSYQKEFPRR